MLMQFAFATHKLWQCKNQKEMRRNHAARRKGFEYGSCFGSAVPIFGACKRSRALRPGVAARTTSACRKFKSGDRGCVSLGARGPSRPTLCSSGVKIEINRYGFLGRLDKADAGRVAPMMQDDF